MEDKNSGGALAGGPVRTGDAGDADSAAGGNIGIPGDRGPEDVNAENAPLGPDAGNTLGDTVGTGPVGGPSDTRIVNGQRTETP